MIKDRKFMVFTTGEDGLIKIWDQTYNLLSKIDVFSFRLASLEDFKRVLYIFNYRQIKEFNHWISFFVKKEKL